MFESVHGFYADTAGQHESLHPRFITNSLMRMIYLSFPVVQQCVCCRGGVTPTVPHREADQRPTGSRTFVPSWTPLKGASLRPAPRLPPQVRSVPWNKQTRLCPCDSRVLPYLSLLPVLREELSPGLVESHSLHPPQGPPLSASRFLRQVAVLSNQLLPARHSQRFQSNSLRAINFRENVFL